jgi:hypothetical protein
MLDCVYTSSGHAGAVVALIRRYLRVHVDIVTKAGMRAPDQLDVGPFKPDGFPPSVLCLLAARRSHRITMRADSVLSAWSDCNAGIC